MTTYQLPLKAHVGTTYKRALERFHLLRDHEGSEGFALLRGHHHPDNWFVRHHQREGRTMRKLRDYDAELKALNDKARQLKTRKTSQLGELVAATGADALTVEELAGALLAIAATSDPAKREAWRKRGAAFFSGEREAGTGSARQSPYSEPDRSAAQPGGDEPSRSPTGTA
jgi:hypothetical protein